MKKRPFFTTLANAWGIKKFGIFTTGPANNEDLSKIVNVWLHRHVSDTPIDPKNIIQCPFFLCNNIVTPILIDRVVKGLSRFLEDNYSSVSYELVHSDGQKLIIPEPDNIIPVEKMRKYIEIDGNYVIYLPTFDLYQCLPRKHYDALQEIDTLSVKFSQVDHLHCPTVVGYGKEYSASSIEEIITMLNCISLELSLDAVYYNKRPPIFGAIPNMETFLSRPYEERYDALTFIMEADGYERSITLTRRELFGLKNGTIVKSLPWLTKLVSDIIRLEI